MCVYVYIYNSHKDGVSSIGNRIRLAPVEVTTPGQWKHLRELVTWVYLA